MEVPKKMPFYNINILLIIHHMNQQLGTWQKNLHKNDLETKKIVTRQEPLVYDTGEFINKCIILTTTNRNGKIIDKKRNCERKNWKRKISY